MDPKVKLVTRLWQYARMKAVGVDDDVLSSAQRLIRAAMAGVDPIRDRAEISGIMYAHIVENTVDFCTSQSCFLCRFREACHDDSEPCSAFESDVLTFDSCRDELARTIKILDRVFGLKADPLINIIRVELDSTRERIAQSHNSWQDM